jgi:RNA polymerase-binding transcription factor DksA/tRNA(Ser,Leu) C12 N-acetylase TAN1
MQKKHVSPLRRRLIERRARLLHEVFRAESDLESLAETRESEFEEHAEDGRTVLLLARLDDRGKAELERIDAALARLDAGRYGVCAGCGGTISMRRLAALPATPYCRDCAERAERGEPLDLEPEPPPRSAFVLPDYNLLTGRELEEVIAEHVREDGRVDVAELRVECRRGVVYLDGVIPSEREHQILLHTVADVMGLSDVVDRSEVRELSWRSDAGGSLDEVPETEPAVAAEGRRGTESPAADARTHGPGAAQPAAGAAWNVLVTAQEGAVRDLRRLLKPHGTFRGSGFRNVLLGAVEDIDRFLATLRLQLEQKPFAYAWLGRVLPIRVGFPVDLESFCSDVESRLGDLTAELTGKSFHVRVERRGHKGRLHTHDLELRFGEFLWNALAARGANPLISFTDPDVVIAVEIVGDAAGIALVGRAWRQAFPFVKID